MATVALVAVLMFALMHLLPGDPAMRCWATARTDATSPGCTMNLASTARSPCSSGTFSACRHAAPWRFVTLRAPVTQLIAERLPITLMLTAMAAVLALLIAVPLAFIAALRQGGWVDVSDPLARTVESVRCRCFISG